MNKRALVSFYWIFTSVLISSRPVPLTSKSQECYIGKKCSSCSFTKTSKKCLTTTTCSKSGCQSILQNNPDVRLVQYTEHNMDCAILLPCNMPVFTWIQTGSSVYKRKCRDKKSKTRMKHRSKRSQDMYGRYGDYGDYVGSESWTGIDFYTDNDYVTFRTRFTTFTRPTISFSSINPSYTRSVATTVSSINPAYTRSTASAVSSINPAYTRSVSSTASSVATVDNAIITSPDRTSSTVTPLNTEFTTLTDQTPPTASTSSTVASINWGNLTPTPSTSSTVPSINWGNSTPTASTSSTFPSVNWGNSTSTASTTSAPSINPANITSTAPTTSNPSINPASTTLAASIAPTTSSITTSMSNAGAAAPTVPQRIYIMACVCVYQKSFTNMSEVEIIEQLISDTQIDGKETTLSQSMLVSRPDSRSSSRIVGTVGIVVLATVFSMLVFCDLLSLIKVERRIHSKKK